MALDLKARRRRARRMDWMMRASLMIAQEAAGSIEHVNARVAVGSENETEMTIPVPDGVAAGDVLLMLLVNDGANDDPTVEDDDTGGAVWTVISGTGTGISLWYKRATSGTAGKTVSVSGMTGGCAGGISAYRNCRASGLPYENLSTETHASGTETRTGITPTVNGAMICFFVGNRSAALGVGFQTCTNPGDLTERFEDLNTTGGCSANHASALQTLVGATGDITWVQTNGATRTFALNLLPL